MRDVLANTSDAHHGLVAHATSKGSHNLSMTGDMPIAHPLTIDLLRALDDAMHEDQGEEGMGATLGVIKERSIAVAEHAIRSLAPRGKHAGATLDRRPPRSVESPLRTVRFACKRLRRPHLYPSIACAAALNTCSRRQCKAWVFAIDRCVRVEAAGAAQALGSGESPGWATAALNHETAIACHGSRHAQP